MSTNTPNSSTSKVVDIATKRPHLTGKAKCLECKYEWVAIASIGCFELECPQCSLMKGAFINLSYPTEPVWHCNCGNTLFVITATHGVCSYCGMSQEFG